MIYKLKIVNFFIVLFLFFDFILASNIPFLYSRVNDYAEILSGETKIKLEKKLENFEKETSNQIAILTIPSLEGEDIESYANKVFNYWKLGQKRKDNGVLLVISVNDRKLRIEVGYGLEGVLTDALASQIIRKEITPHFKNGNYDHGVENGIKAIINATKGEYKFSTPLENQDDIETIPFPLNVLVALFVFTILGIFTLIGITTSGCQSWFLYIFLIPFYSLFPVFIFGAWGGFVILIIYLIFYPVLKILFAKKFAEKFLTQKLGFSPYSTFGTFASSGYNSSSGSSSWSFGSFSGGGGSSGGGGASGSW